MNTLNGAGRTPAGSDGRKQYVVRVRGREVPRDMEVKFYGDTPQKAFQAALDANTDQAEPILSWGSDEDIAAVDIDFHGDYKPDPDEFYHRVSVSVTPGPALYWVTHGGGYRLMYFRDGPHDFTAAEKAALAMIDIRAHLTRNATGVEFKRDTRHPKFPRADGAKAGPIRPSGPHEADAGRVAARFLRLADAVDEGAVAEWRDEQGYDEGRRISHEHCPIDPTPGDAKNDCVVHLDGGVYCHRCDGKGIAFPGVGRPGFVPWQKLMDEAGGEARHSHIRAAVKNFAHWGHAGYIIRAHTGLDEKYARLLYRALLRTYHGDRGITPQAQQGYDRLADKCFFPPVPLVRADGYWALPKDLTTSY
jgi:hypothetical protein